MIINNVEMDVKMKCIEQNVTQQQLGDAIGTTGQYVNRIIKKKGSLINNMFVKMMDELGYDIEMVYVPKKGE